MIGITGAHPNVPFTKVAQCIQKLTLSPLISCSERPMNHQLYALSFNYRCKYGKIVSERAGDNAHKC